MKPIQALLTLAALTLLAAPALAHLGGSDFFISSDECQALSPECTCDDLPMMSLFAQDQGKALNAWKQTKDAILTPDGPSTQSAAIEDFQGQFNGDPRITAQFMTCPDFDATINDPRKIAGVDLGAVLDPCFCQTFCKDITYATALHERTHVAFGFVALTEMISTLVPCKTGQLDQAFCDSLDAQYLADSEILAHQVGIAALELGISNVNVVDAVTDEFVCSWERLPSDPPTPPAPAPPADFWNRVEVLATRFVHGANTPSL